VIVENLVGNCLFPASFLGISPWQQRELNVHSLRLFPQGNRAGNFAASRAICPVASPQSGAEAKQILQEKDYFPKSIALSPNMDS
jgi:hypothetical protein